MNRKIISIFLFGACIYCLACIFLGIYKPLGNYFIARPMKNYLFYPGNNILFGDLYKFSGINDFKEEMNIKIGLANQTASNIEDAQIITIGDSFFGISFDGLHFSGSLQKKLKQPVFYQWNLSAVDYPLEFLKSIKYQKTGKPKFLILETIERLSKIRTNTYNQVAPKFSNLNAEPPKTLRSIIFDIKYLFLNNIISFPVIAFIKTLRFNLTGNIDPAISTYSLNPLNLFYFQETLFTEEDKNINNIVDSIHTLALKLKNDYNLILIYVVMPNKYSIYHETAVKNTGYDDYIHKVVEQLRKRNIPAPDVYTKFRNFIKIHPDIPLYYKSDTHYNSTGRDLAADVVAEQIKELQPEKNLAVLGPVNFNPKANNNFTEEEFNEQAYLRAFRDIKDAVNAGHYANGYEHYDRYGRNESRLQSPQYIIELKRIKKVQ
jgi:hypothetical protein